MWYFSILLFKGVMEIKTSKLSNTKMLLFLKTNKDKKTPQKTTNQNQQQQNKQKTKTKLYIEKTI